MKKRILYFFIATITILNLVSILAHAESDIIVELNGKKIQFDQPPIIQNDRTLVPMRAIFEAMGCDVEWDGENQWITATKDNITIEMMIDYNFFWVTDYGEDGTYARTLSLDVSPQIINGRTLVPLRAISESIGAAVDWNGFTRTVTITYTEATSNNTSLSDYDCLHINTHDVTLIDLRECINTGSSETHKVIDTVMTAVRC